MKKFGFAPLLLAIFLCLLLPAAARDIGSADALVSLMNDPAAWSGDWTLTADIDLTGKTQSPIGNYETPFTGSFDGAGHTVSGLHIAAGEAAGLFGVTEGATVQNLTVVGSAENTFAAETAETRVEGRYPGTGGIVGVALSGTTIKNCTSRAAVKGYGNVGGLCGVVYSFGLATVRIDGCRSEAAVESLRGNAGGLIGRIYTASVAFPAVVVSNSPIRRSPRKTATASAASWATSAPRQGLSSSKTVKTPAASPQRTAARCLPTTPSRAASSGARS